MTGILQAILSFFGVAPAAAANYIEDVFSTYLYTGNGSTQTITNGIDLSGKGGLVWTKNRSPGGDHILVDTARGVNKYLISNTTAAQDSAGPLSVLPTFTSTGYTVSDYNNVNTQSYVGWTFREQAKFFDVVTYTGNGSNRTIAHNLGSVPGCFIVKKINGDGRWSVYHRSLGNTKYLQLNATNAEDTVTTFWNSTDPTSTVFSIGTNSIVNASGDDYIVYLFAHDAGGFGATGADNVISCGTFTASATETATVTLGYEPQWLLFKPTSTTGDWQIVDNMRRWPVASDAYSLKANLSAAEANFGAIKPSATGFYATSNLIANATYIYIAIRRGPMKTPTSGTSVFSPVVYTGTNVDNRLVDMSLLTDMAFVRQRNDTVLGGMVVGDRLRGDPYLLTGTTDAEVSDADSFMTPTAGYGNSWSAMNGFGVGNDATSKLNASTTSNNQIAEGFRRAPGFFDVVCYTGTGANMTIAHNLKAAPELIIIKKRSAAGDNWPAYICGASTFTSMHLNSTQVTGGNLGVNLSYGGGNALSSAPTSSNFYLQNDAAQTTNAATFVTYLFATVAGVSKVGSYTGTGTTLQVDCGFTAGSRFVMIKRTDSTGDWYVWDSARGIVAGDDPYLLLNSTAAEVTNTDYVDTSNAGFEISSTAPAAINANGGTYIFLAIA